MDLVVFAPHPDDAELSCGGLLIKMADRGYTTAVVDLTRGEMGTRGDPQTRAKEAAAAARILGLSERRNLGLPDGALRSDPPARRAVAEAVRALRPTVVALPYWEDQHPDHIHASQLVYEGVHLARLKNFDAAGKSFAVRGLIYSMGRQDFAPSFVVDLCDEYARKVEAVRTYASQLHAPGREGPKTDIGAEDFLRRFEARHVTYGATIGAAYGEPYFMREPLPIADPVQLFRKEMKGDNP